MTFARLWQSAEHVGLRNKAKAEREALQTL
jgi:hypothetical protein